MTRRDLLTAAIAVAGSTLVAEAPLRSERPDSSQRSPPSFGSANPPTLKTISFPITKVIGTRIGKRVTGVLTTLNTEMVIGRQVSGRRKIRSTWRFPYGEFTDADRLKISALRIPWYRSGVSPLLKNRWVEIRRNGLSCFAQWQDVGPCGEDDFDFVFGDATMPLNVFDTRAGLDVSPAVWHYLGMTRQRFDGLALCRRSRCARRTLDGNRHDLA